VTSRPKQHAKNKEPTSWPALIVPSEASALESGRFLAARITERFEEDFFFGGGHYVDTVPSANLFAQQASDAGLFIDLHLAEVDRVILRRGRDALERAYVDAHAASVAVVRMHHGDRSLGALEHVSDHAVIGHDRFVRANHAASAAIDAGAGLDEIN